jgi:hypothetical protein
MSERHLTPGEVALGRSVYGDAIDYDKVLITDEVWNGPLSLESSSTKNRAHTPDGNMHFPGTSYSPHFSKEPVEDIG